MPTISRREFLKTSALAAGALGLSGVGAWPALARAGEASGADARLSFLFINTDQQRWDALGCGGCAVAQTPNVDRLAAEGVIFPKCFNTHPVCMPSRASWFTGQYPRTHGVWHNGVPLDPGADMIQNHLKAAGYHTALIGKIHLDNIWDRRTKHPLYGFDLTLEANGDPFYKDEYFQWLEAQDPKLFANYDAQIRRHGHVAAFTRDLDEDLHMNNWMAGHVERYFDDRRRDGKPFFLSVGFFDPHHPFDPCEPYASRFDPADMPLPRRQDGEEAAMTPHARKRIRDDIKTESHIRQVIAAYHAKCAHVDAMVGRILRKLEATGLEQRTVVIFTSDHGEMLGDHGLILKGPLFYEGAMRVPLVCRFPKHMGIRGVDQGFASHVDFAPTIAALAGVKGPRFVQGQALFDRAGRIRPQPAPDAALTEWREPGEMGGGMARMLVTDDWKYVHYYDNPCGELYDRRRDPHEFVNLWGTPAAKAPTAEMKERLDRFLFARAVDDTKPFAERTGDF